MGSLIKMFIVHTGLTTKEEKVQLDDFVMAICSESPPHGPNPFDLALSASNGTPLISRRNKPNTGDFPVFVCFGGGSTIGIWRSRLELEQVNRPKTSHFIRGFSSMAQAIRALKLVKLYGGLDRGVRWDMGYWVILKGVRPGWCYGR